MEQITNATIKQVHSLETLKNRRELGLFKAEGTKAVLDTLGAFALKSLYAVDGWAQAQPVAKSLPVVTVSRRDMERMSSLSTPSDVIAIYEIPSVEDCDLIAIARSELLIALDTIQDPGNLGTIVRTADWFGIRHIICGRGTADIFAPKVVQATMGAIARVKAHYCDLASELRTMRDGGVEIYGMALDGTDLYEAPVRNSGVIVIGNEGRGISEEVGATLTRRLRIPSYPGGIPTSESLNAAVATAVTVAEFRRRCRQ